MSSPDTGPSVQVFHPFPRCADVVVGRVAARSAAFAAEAGDGAAVIVGAAAGRTAEDVSARARGELIERVSNVLAGRAAEAAAARVGSYNQLRRARMPVLDPLAWRDATAGEGARDVPMLWVEGVSLLSGEAVLVPAGATYLRHRPPSGCGILLQAGSTGAAAHVSRDAAVDHALLEVLERDIVSRSWYEGEPRPQFAQLSSALVERVLGELALHLTSLLLAGPGGTGCVVACVHAEGGEEQSFGARGVVDQGEESLGHALEVAVYEALMVRWSMGTPEARRAWDAMRNRGPDACPRGAVEHALRAFHLQDSLAHWLTWVSPRRTQNGSHQADPAQALADRTGQDVVIVDTTSPAICREGVTVVRIVAPGVALLPGDERSVHPLHTGALPHPFG
jgi:ribosomal protein S12 methylthiotransferase accessory factor